MTDKELYEIIRKIYRRFSKSIDYVGAVKYYCVYLASGEKSLTYYYRDHKEGIFGYKNEQSFVAGMPYVYNKIKDYLGRDFWQDVAGKPEMEIVPPEPKAPDMAEFMAGVLIGLREIKLLIKENTNVQRNLLTEIAAMREGMKK